MESPVVILLAVGVLVVGGWLSLVAGVHCHCDERCVGCCGGGRVSRILHLAYSEIQDDRDKVGS